MTPITNDDWRIFIHAYDDMLSDRVPLLGPHESAVGYSAVTPQRAEVPPPKGLREFAKTLGLDVTVSSLLENYPMYTPKPVPHIQMPAPHYFESDAAVWHALLHESAHHLHFYKHGHLAKVSNTYFFYHEHPNSGPGSKQFRLRADTEVVAESAAFMALSKLGLVYKPEYSKTFLDSWASYTKVGEEHLRIAIEIAHELVCTYQEAMAHADIYYQS